jgi:hypothetical protein
LFGSSAPRPLISIVSIFFPESPRGSLACFMFHNC